jgi:hypothetical protein
MSADDYSFEGCRLKLVDATRIVIAREEAYANAVEEAADAEAFYRVQLAEAFKRLRDGGAAVEAANTVARGECAVHSRARDAAAGRLKLAAEKLEDARDSRRSLWRLIEWARGRDLATAGAAPENVPGERWP